MIIVVICVLTVSSAVAVVALCRYPRLWLWSFGVLATATVIVLLPWILGTQFKPSGSEDYAFNFGFFFVCLYSAAYVGVFHLGFFLILIGSLIEERKRYLHTHSLYPESTRR